MLDRFDGVHGYTVQWHVAGVDELMSYTAWNQHRISRVNRVFLATTNKYSSALRNERLMLPCVRVVGT